MELYLEIVGGASPACFRQQELVEHEASTFPLDILTKVSTAAHSTRNLV